MKSDRARGSARGQPDESRLNNSNLNPIPEHADIGESSGTPGAHIPRRVDSDEDLGRSGEEIDLGSVDVMTSSAK